MINDGRLFPFCVDAQWTEQEDVVLTGFVGYEENRMALFDFFRDRGYGRIHHCVEVLPSKDLGGQPFALVTASHSLCYDQPTGRQEVLTDCLLAAPLYLLKESAAGFFLCHGVEGYVGYIHGQDIRRVDRNEFSRYQAGPQLCVRHDVRTATGLLVPTGTRLKYVARRGQEIAAELPAGGQTLLATDSCFVCDGRPSPRIERVIENATKFLGTKYRWGGNTAEGIDCSGLIQVSFAAEGIHLPRDSNQQVYLGSLTATRWYRDGLRRGDTLYFLGRNGKISHTALYLGEGRYIEAVRPAVRYTSFRPEDEEFNPDRAAAFCVAKRLLE
jgi:hypothetical protein